jgi:hypothetical protein
VRQRHSGLSFAEATENALLGACSYRTAKKKATERMDFDLSHSRRWLWSAVKMDFELLEKTGFNLSPYCVHIYKGALVVSGWSQFCDRAPASTSRRGWLEHIKSPAVELGLVWVCWPTPV